MASRDADPWTDALRLDDEALISAIVLAPLPEISLGPSRRDQLLEALRARYDEVASEAVARRRVDVLRDPTAVADFLDFAWAPERMLSCLQCWLAKAPPRGSFRSYLELKIRSLVIDFLRHQKRRGGPAREQALERPAPGGCEGLSAARLEAMRACVEAVPIRYRAPFKLQYVALFDLDDRDLAHLSERTRRSAETIRASIAGKMPTDGGRLALVDIAALAGIGVTSVGTYVNRASKLVQDCVKRRLAREEAT